MAEVIRVLRLVGQKERKERIPRKCMDRFNSLECYGDEELFHRYGFRRSTIFVLVNLISGQIAHETRRSLGLPPVLQVLTFLQFVATGAFHVLVCEALHISKSTAGRCVRGVTDAICRHASTFIKFPSGQRLLDVKRKFHAIAGFPKVAGCIYGTQVRIIAPVENEPDFVNRKGYHSLNVQMVCDPSFLITNCVANWPGSCHDSRIFRESKLSENFEYGLHDGILLGDSGYRCRRYLMTPDNNTNNIRHKEKFNSALSRTRVLIQQTFGILKRRFPCLSVGLRTNPPRACKYIVACVILHNIGILQSDIVISDVEELTLQDPDNQLVDFHVNDGFGIRDVIAQTYFA